MGTFIGGLKFEIAEGIRMFKPKTLKEAIGLARMKDEQLSKQKKVTRFSTTVGGSMTSNNPKPASPMKRISWEEMQKRRAQGLCFNCDDKFVLGHKCKGPQLLLLEGNPDDEEEQDDPEISLHALTGWSAARTMRIIAKVGSHELVVLIDSGSTHNFINEKIAELLQLPAVPTEPFNVKVANGAPLKCQGRFENVRVWLQGIPFTLTLYSVPLIGLDMVLGIHWLEQLGTIMCDWRRMTMDFIWEGQPHQLEGMDSKPIQPTAL